MTFSEACEAQNKLYKALDALIELPSDKYKQTINDLRTDIDDIEQKLSESKN